MTSTSSYMVTGEHDEVMTVEMRPQPPQGNTFMNDDPVLSSSQYQVTTLTKKKTSQSIDTQLFSNQNEKDIDNYDDKELLKILGNINEDNFENGKLQKEQSYQQTHESNNKNGNNPNKAQLNDITKQIGGTNEGYLQDKEDINKNNFLAYLDTSSSNTGNAQVHQNLETSEETTIVLTSAEIIAQIVAPKITHLQNPAQAQIVLTPTTTQIVDKQVIPGLDVPQIYLNSRNTMQSSQQQGIPVQNTVMIPAQSYHDQKQPPQAYSWANGVDKTDDTTSITNDTTTATSAAKTDVYDAIYQQPSTTQYFSRDVNTRNTRKVCSPTKKRAHEDEIEDDNKDKDFQIQKKGKINGTNSEKKIKKWEIKEEMKDPVEEQKRLNAKKAHDHRMKEKREKEAMKEKIKNLEQRVKDLETNNRVLQAENNLLKQFKIRY